MSLPESTATVMFQFEFVEPFLQPCYLMKSSLMMVSRQCEHVRWAPFGLFVVDFLQTSSDIPKMGKNLEFVKHFTLFVTCWAIA